MKALIVASSLLCALIATPAVVAQTAEQATAAETAQSTKTAPAKAAKSKNTDVKKRGVGKAKPNQEGCDIFGCEYNPPAKELRTRGIKSKKPEKKECNGGPSCD